jgi:FixJ family two-component response regulator
MQFTEAMVYLVSNNSARVTRLSQFFSSRRIGVMPFESATEFVTSECTAKVRDERIACLILDLDFPCLSGLEIQRRLAGTEAPPIIFVTEHGDTLSGVCAMKNGAIDVMMEPLDDVRLMAAVEIAFAIHRRNRNEQVERTALLACWKSLTPRETEVFRHTTAGLLNKQASSELGIAENTYQVHRGRVMRKMRAGSLADLVRMSTKIERIFRRMRKESALRQPVDSMPGEQSNVVSIRGSHYALPDGNELGATSKAC